MTEKQFKKIYDFLVCIGGASESERESFIYHHTKATEICTEWRFSGLLGFGGKYRSGTNSVDCYSEDENKERLSIIILLNNVLKSVYKKEYILCAATWFDDGKEHSFQPYNIPSGLVLCGWRHGSIFPQIGGLVKERQELGIFEKDQGFLTNLNRFVNREEAAEIAFESGQIKEKLKRLHSEDLY